MKEIRMLSRKALWAAAFAVLSLPTLAQDPAQRLIERYTPLAGSESNAKALVDGLRDGTEVTLKSSTGTTTIDPPTRKMGYGNIDNALAIAEASLQKQGVAQPTPSELKGALSDVLQARADGRGWGEIANSYGFRLGELKRPERAQRVEKPERPQRPEKPERPQRPDHPRR